MKKSWLLLLIFIGVIVNAQDAPTSRPLIIIFDSKNSDTKDKAICRGGAMKFDMSSALNQQTAPIIASRWLLDYLTSCQSQEDREKLFSPWDVYTSDPSIIFPDTAAHDPIIICIPKKEGATAGFNMGKLTKIDPSSITPLTVTSPSDDLRTYLNNILITNNKTDKSPIVWDIYLTGHGSLTTTIAGMSIASFKSLLAFLNFSIPTRSLFYTTCYSGGANLKSPYTYTTDITQDSDFNFMIIAANAISAPTYTSSYHDFKKYFTGINDYYGGVKNLSLTQVIRNVADWSDTFKHANFLVIPAVRYPHTGWFSVDQIDKRLFCINESVIKGKKEINIPADTEVVLLQTNYIPIPVIISSNQVPVLAPQDSSIHYFFKEIIAPNASLLSPTSWTDYLKTDFVKWMQASMGFGSAKTSQDFLTMYLKLQEAKFDHFFFIEKLTTQLKNQQTQSGTLGWGDGPLLFQNVILRSALSPAIPQIALTHKNQSAHFVTQQGYWTLGKSSAMPDFQKMKTSIQEKSTLPASIITEAPQPAMQEPLYFGYMQRRDNPVELEAWKKTLTQEKLERLERLLEEIPPPLE